MVSTRNRQYYEAYSSEPVTQKPAAYTRPTYNTRRQEKPAHPTYSRGQPTHAQSTPQEARKLVNRSYSARQPSLTSPKLRRSPRTSRANVSPTLGTHRVTKPASYQSMSTFPSKPTQNHDHTDYIALRRQEAMREYDTPNKPAPPTPTSAQIRLQKAKSRFREATDGEPVLLTPLPYSPTDYRPSTRPNRAIYRRTSRTPISTILSPDRRTFLERQAQLSTGAVTSWTGFGHMPDSSATLPDRVFKIAQTTVKKYPGTHRVEKYGRTLRLLERRNTLDKLTDAERRELVKWWERRFGHTRKVVRKEEASVGWAEQARRFFRMRRRG